MMIKDRAHSIAFVDEDDEEMGSEDERNGVGNPIPLSAGDPGYTKGASQSQGTLLSGWSATQSHPPDNHKDTNDESLAEYADLSQTSARLLTMGNPASSAPAATNLRPSPVVPQAHHEPHGASATSSARLTNTAPGSTATPAAQGSAAARRAKAAQPQAALHTTITSFFNPEARAARDQETSMSHFYAARLQEANSLIVRLQDEANRLRDGVNLQVIRLQEEVQQARLDLASKTAENQDLRHRIEMLQLRLEMQHTNGFGMPGMMQAPMFVQSNTHQNPSAWEVNTGSSNPRAH
ncbi:hypothetical protein PGT21_010296 [Puccinia graminis f. sp. tritici]|uniref:Uncharacterized protein n=1 Tax=Puccinia graminis f. sp. tritici TaxID=56615 RepID=A0A5B0MBV4_PUCGR|nr:hypothetical protein PGT21_010296 [Puccinia graminis f. sp. tritici]KAA1116007.1 hypothetical protein PGTUg99_032293 [Puccinia graminis f. sp. tritici]